ncbi:unnamed protein product [Mortierella alpina]
MEADVAAGRQSTVLHLKELIRQRIESTSAVSSGLELSYNSYTLDNTDTLEHLSGKFNWGGTSDCISLVASYAEHRGERQDSEPCSPAPLRFRTGSGASITSPSAAPGAMSISGTYCGPRAFSRSMDGFSETKTGEQDLIAEVFSHAAPNATSMAPYQYAIQQSLYRPLCTSEAPSQQYPVNSGERAILEQQHHNLEAPAADGREQDHAPRDQRRAAALWLLLKLAFGVYVLSQNGSIERIVLLHVAAFIIFLHQTGRLRIVRRVVPQPQERPEDPAADAGHQAPASADSQNDGPSPHAHATDGSISSSSAPSGSSKAADSRQKMAPMMSGCKSQRNEESMPNERKGLAGCPLSADHQDLAQPTADEYDLQEHVQDEERARTEEEQPPRLSSWCRVEHALLMFVTSLVPAPPPEIEPALANAAAAADNRAM